MSFMPARPNMPAQAAGDLQSVSTSMSDGNVDAADATTGVTPAAADVVSALVAAQFAAHAHVYQAVSEQVAAVQAMLADTLGIDTGSDPGTDAVTPVTPANGQDEVLQAGHDSRPLLAAAAAWDGLAANLQSTAATYASLISKLADQQWQDPVSASMAAGATRQVAWLASFAGQAKQAAAQAEDAAEGLADRLFRSA
jgi:PPE-repeat protein